MSFNVKVPLGEIRGTGVVRDKDGNIKAHIVLTGTTDLTAQELKAKLKESAHGSNTDDSRP